MQPYAEPPVDPQAARQAAVEILSQPEYQPKASSWLARALDIVAEWLDRLLPDLGGSPASPGVSRLWSVVAWVVIVALLGFGLVAVVRSLRAGGWPSWRRRRGRQDHDPDEIQLDQTSPAVPTEGLASDHEAAGRWRDALLVRYRATVVRLADSGVVTPGPGTSSAEIRKEVAELLEPAGVSFARLTETFETVWYGGAPADAHTVTEAKENAAHVSRPIDTSGRPPNRASGSGRDRDAAGTGRPGVMGEQLSDEVVADRTADQGRPS